MAAQKRNTTESAGTARRRGAAATITKPYPGTVTRPFQFRDTGLMASEGQAVRPLQHCIGSSQPSRKLSN